MGSHRCENFCEIQKVSQNLIPHLNVCLKRTFRSIQISIDGLARVHWTLNMRLNVTFWFFVVLNLEWFWRYLELFKHDIFFNQIICKTGFCNENFLRVQGRAVGGQLEMNKCYTLVIKCANKPDVKAEDIEQVCAKINRQKRLTQFECFFGNLAVFQKPMNVCKPWMCEWLAGCLAGCCVYISSIQKKKKTKKTKK